MQPDTTGWAPAGGGPQHRQPAPTRGVLFAATGRSKAWLCTLLILAGLSGSAAQTVLPLPLASSDPGTAASESAAPEPAAPAADAPEPLPLPDGGAGTREEAPSLDLGTDDPAAADSSPDLADSVTVAQIRNSTQGGPLGVSGSWKLVLADDFDSLNTAVWTPYWFNDCNPRSLKNNVKTCSSNIRIANGEAVLQLSDDSSGALLSSNPQDGVPGHAGFEFTSGYAEARIYFPGSCSRGIDNWSAWWTAGQSFPGTGEIDIAEPLAGQMWSVYHSAAGKKSRPVPGCWAGEYHTYGLHRKAGSNDIYYDGNLVHTYATRDGNSPHYLLLNVGVWKGARILGEAGSIRIDYVRVWQ